jgi:hypothetical protein
LISANQQDRFSFARRGHTDLKHWQERVKLKTAPIDEDTADAFSPWFYVTEVSDWCDPRHDHLPRVCAD